MDDDGVDDNGDDDSDDDGDDDCDDDGDDDSDDDGEDDGDPYRGKAKRYDVQIASHLTIGSVES